jgi:hypothetical protein
VATDSLVTVEFFGIPRQQAGRAEVNVPAGTLREVLDAACAICPSLLRLTRSDGTLGPHYLFSLDGERFFQDATEWVVPGARILVLSADAGG